MKKYKYKCSKDNTHRCIHTLCALDNLNDEQVTQLENKTEQTIKEIKSRVSKRETFHRVALWSGLLILCIPLGGILQDSFVMEIGFVGIGVVIVIAIIDHILDRDLSDIRLGIVEAEITERRKQNMMNDKNNSIRIEYRIKK